MVKAELIRRAMVVTPNIPEAEVLADTTIRIARRHARRPRGESCGSGLAS